MTNEQRAFLQLACLVGLERARAVYPGGKLAPDERDGTLEGFRFFASQLWHPPAAWPDDHRPYREYHWAWAGLVLRERHCGIMAPRGHGKSSRLGAPYVAWRTIFHPDEAWLVTSSTPGRAQSLVNSIADRLAVDWWAPGIPGPAAVFPGVVMTRRTGHPAELWYTTRKLKREDPNVRGAGILGEGITGYHWDGVLADDVVGEENSQTRGRREQVEGYWARKLLPSLTGPKLLKRLFTLYHPADLNAQAVRAGLPVSDEYRSAVVGDLHSPEARALDDNYYTIAALRDAYAEMGPVAFALQFQNDATAAEGVYFQREWIEVAAEDCDPPERMARIVLTGDLAYGDSRDSDYTALVVAGRSRDGRYYLLDMTRHRYPEIAQVADEIARLHRAWKPHVVGVEAGPGAMSQMHRQLDLLLRDRGIGGLKRLKADREKTARATGLQARLSTGVWKIPHSPGGKLAALRDEMLTFPHGEHDDMVDALAYADIELTGPRSSGAAPLVVTADRPGWA